MKRARHLLLLALLLAPVLLKGEVQSFNKFSGLNTDDSPLQLQDGQTPDSENVLTDDGPGVQGRKGFVSFSTEPSAGLWEFPLSNGTRYIITKSGGNLKAATANGIFSILISTVPSDRVTAAAPLGDKFYFADTLNGLKYWNATAVFVASASLTVDKLVTWKGRLAAAGLSGATRTIYLSKLYDGTSWTAPTNPSDDDAAQITVSGALDENIQALYASFQDKLMWMKTSAFGGIFGSRRSNFIQRTFSDRVGVSSPETIQDCDGKLRWLGANRIVWEFDGSTFYKISEDVDTLFAAVSQGDSAQRSLIQTTQADWTGGTQSPSSFADTDTTPGSVTPRTTTYTDTSAADVGGGSCSPATYCDTTTVSGSVYLATTTPVTAFVDTDASDFGAGTLTQISSTTTSGSIVLAFQPQFLANSSSCSGLPVGPEGGSCLDSLGRSFQVPLSVVLSTVTLPLGKTGTPSGGMRLRVFSDSGNSPGTMLASSIDHSVQDLTSSTAAVTWSNWVDLGNNPISAPALLANTTYWIKINQTNGSCNPLSSFFTWDQIAGCDPTRRSIFNETGNTADGRFGFKIYASTYYATGNIVSRSFDVGFTTATWLWSWSTFTVTSTLNGGTATYQTQTSSDSINWNTLATVVSGSTAPSTVQRYIRYKASLTGGATNTPTINDVTLNMTDRIRPTAVFTSRTLDTGFGTPVWGLLNATVSQQASGGTSQFMTQASADGVTWDAGVVTSTGFKIQSTPKRYLRYLYQSTATSVANYARLDDATVTAKATGTFTSAAFTIGSLITAWGPVTLSLSNGGGSTTIQFSTSTNGVTFSSWTTISNNATPTVSTAPYAAVRVLFTMDVATQTPTLADITVNWVEGSNIRAASIFFNQRYWLAVATTSTTNNLVLVYDKKKQWQRYSAISATALSLYNSALYFGNSGGIYHAETGYNDNGSNINSYYQTPAITPAGLDSKAKFLWFYTTTDSSDSTLSTSYQIDSSSTTYNFGSSAMNNTNGIQNIKLPFSADEVQEGRLINIKWSIPGTSFWRVLNGSLYFDRDTIPE